MLGWINDCIEKFVLEKFDEATWEEIKLMAGCNIPTGGFVRLDHYSDKSTYDLVEAAATLADLSTSEVYERAGAFFFEYIAGVGYGTLLQCQGDNLKDYCSNVNAIHQHLQMSFPKKMTMPYFWCTVENGDQLMLHYYSKRGSFLAPLAKGLISEIARSHFGMEVDMRVTRTQGVYSKTTTWHITAVDPKQAHKLMGDDNRKTGSTTPVDFSKMKCPFTGVQVPEAKCPAHHGQEGPNAAENTGADMKCPSQQAEPPSTSKTTGIGISAEVTKSLFPYGVVLNESLQIIQLGKSVSKILQTTDDVILGNVIGQVFEITKPVGVAWTWEWLTKFEDQTLYVDYVMETTTVCREPITFKTSVLMLSDNPSRQIMLIMAPNATNLDNLLSKNLTISDMPIHGDYRDAVFLREHLSKHMSNSLTTEKSVGRTLLKEKQLLDSLMPRHAASDLRAGKTVRPRLHEHVTFFFSDIVDFTKLCEDLHPWQVIDLLNRLYATMDYLANHFDLFKVETIGDAYLCCSGLPNGEEYHAEKVANFAIAVQHCCKHVLAPITQEPIQLRVGVHTGSAASGLVGTTNARYCVFGDAVNTTARHESTGKAGRIHCSETTFQHLQGRQAASYYTLKKERRLVPMKGKGDVQTYWLSGSEKNLHTNQTKLAELEAAVLQLLRDTKFEDSDASCATGSAISNEAFGSKEGKPREYYRPEQFRKTAKKKKGRRGWKKFLW